MNHSILQSLPLIVQICVPLALFFMLTELKRRHHETEQRWNKRQMLMQSELGKLRSTVTDLERRLEDAEKRADLDTPIPVPSAGVNLNRRSQAIRLLRRGDRPEQVAATLGIPAPETDLLLKVYRIVTARVAGN